MPFWLTRCSIEKNILNRIVDWSFSKLLSMCICLEFGELILNPCYPLDGVKMRTFRVFVSLKYNCDLCIIEIRIEYVCLLSER